MVKKPQYMRFSDHKVVRKAACFFTVLQSSLSFRDNSYVNTSVYMY
jgi:Zn/Cd-binding protein ZinT